MTPPQPMRNSCCPIRAALIEGLEVNAFIGVINDEPEFRPYGQGDHFRRDAIYGVRVSYMLPQNFFVEGQGSNALVSMTSDTGRRNVNSFFFGGALGYSFWPQDDFQGFVIAGADAAHLRPDRLSTRTELSLNGGVGGRLFLTDRHAIRGDARMRWIPSAVGDIQNDLMGGADILSENLWALELSVGVSFFPGL